MLLLIVLSERRQPLGVTWLAAVSGRVAVPRMRPQFFPPPPHADSTQTWPIPWHPVLGPLQTAPLGPCLQRSPFLQPSLPSSLAPAARKEHQEVSPLLRSPQWFLFSPGVHAVTFQGPCVLASGCFRDPVTRHTHSTEATLTSGRSSNASSTF